MMSPGNYLARRRHAAGLTIADVAASISTAPHLAEIDRRAWLLRIESDIAALSADVIRTLRDVYPFSPFVLQQLVDFRSYGDPLTAPRVCMFCGCSDQDRCAVGCAWETPNTCTVCTPPIPPQELAA